MDAQPPSRAMGHLSDHGDGILANRDQPILLAPFWQDSLALAEVDRSLGRRIKGPSQITDAYLLVLARHYDGRMVTFDYRMESLAPEGSVEREALVILRP